MKTETLTKALSTLMRTVEQKTTAEEQVKQIDEASFQIALAHFAKSRRFALLMLGNVGRIAKEKADWMRSVDPVQAEQLPQSMADPALIEKLQKFQELYEGGVTGRRIWEYIEKTLPDLSALDAHGEVQS